MDEAAYYVFFIFVALISYLLLLPLLNDKKLPPGPRPWPLIGNLPLISRQRPHADMAELARRYGPLLSLRLGTQLVVIGSSPAAAVDILKTHDRILSSRFVPHAYRLEVYTPFSLPFAVECDQRWKSLRSLCKSELFSMRTMDLQSKMREEKVCQMVGWLAQRKGDEVNIAEMVFKTVFNILGNVILSKDVVDHEKNSKYNDLKTIFSRLAEIALAVNVADLYPTLSALDIQGLKRECRQLKDKVYEIWDAFINERKNEKDCERKFDFLSVLLSANLQHNQIRALFTDMFIGGTDTTTTAIEWAMSELITNPKAMARARSEVKTVVGENSVKESHLHHLSYTHACIKETLRLHPPVPFLLPRQAKEECTVMNHTVPKGTRVMVNVWAIGRDPAVWTDPEKFLPERFLEASKDYKGSDFDYTPFGGGRRICPGIPLAARTMVLMVASLIHRFEWSLPLGMKPEDVDMAEKFRSVLVKAKPLVLIPHN